MSAHIKTLHELNNDIIYPQTITKAVFDEDGMSLDIILSNIRNTSGKSFDIVLLSDGWVDIDDSDILKYDDYIYCYRVDIPDMLASYNPKMFTNYISVTQNGKIEEDRAIGLIKDILTFDGYVIAYAYQRPSVDVKIILTL